MSSTSVSARIDGIYRTRTPGVAARGVPDQYADGKAAKVWKKYIGEQKKRTNLYKERVVSILNEFNCKNVLDVASGTGVDSIMLLEEGFKVTSVDASDKMLKQALKTRWERRKEEIFDNWVIEEGNWLALREANFEVPGEGFDAIICMGNSFAHLPDFDGKQSNHYQAIENFRDCLRPGGILLIDHRNYDHIVSGGKAPMKNIYYQSESRIDIKTSVLMVDGKYQMVTLDYTVFPDDHKEDDEIEGNVSKFRLSYYPHVLKGFNKLLEDVFTEKAKHKVLADFQSLESEPNPAYYIHIIEKPAREDWTMGVRTKTVKKASRVIIEKYYARMTLDFQTNKRVCEEVAIIPSKALKNKIAGYATHLMKRIQRGPVRGISLKLQEEERERRMDFVPEVSAVDTDVIEVDAETKAMLRSLDMGNLQGIVVHSGQQAWKGGKDRK